MRIRLIILLSIICNSAFSQMENGYVKSEVRDMIAICNSFAFIELYGSDSEIIPEGYRKIYTSETIGMDNKFQIYRNGKVAVINLRGSTAKKSSWLENFYSEMIPAKGVIGISGESHQYTFADHEDAAVHSGYALAIAYLSKDITAQIKKLNSDKVYHIIVTGHSQGGALAQLLRAYLENQPSKTIAEKNKFKTYSFASPMTGNKHFAEEYSKRYCNGSSYNIINPKDLVTTLPLSYNDSNYVSQTDFIALLFNRESLDLKHKIIGGTIHLLEKPLSKIIHKVGEEVYSQINKGQGGYIKMPLKAPDINYMRLNEVVEIIPTPYPKKIKDPSILQNDSLMAIYKKGDDGYFVDENLYKKEPMFFQHKPYNYYASILKLYYPASYEKLEMKYLEGKK